MINVNNLVAKGRMTSRRAIVVLVIACFMGLASQVSALTTTSDEFMGIVISGEPASSANEVVYINTLADQAINTSTTIAGHVYNRSDNTLCFNTCVDAIVDDTIRDETGGSDVDLGD